MCRYNHAKPYIAARESQNVRKLRRVSSAAHEAGILFIYISAMLAAARIERSESTLAEIRQTVRGTSIEYYAQKRCDLVSKYYIEVHESK